MRRSRKIKLITIIVLIVAVVGMSIGFAAFSSVLTISSRATVTPDVNFDFKIYGVLNPDAAESSLQISDTKAVCAGGEGVSCSDAMIDNENFTISNLSFEMTKPGTGAFYLFGVVNEGNIAGYIDLNPFRNYTMDYINTEFGILSKSCVAHEGTSQSLVNSTCENITMYVAVKKITGSSQESIEDSELENGFYKLEPGNAISLMFLLSYGDADVTLADGPFTVNFEDAVFNFVSSIPQS